MITTKLKTHGRYILVVVLSLMCLMTFRVNAASFNPVNFSSLLSEQLSTEDMTEICDYYELSKVSETDSLIKYVFPTGDKVTFFMQPENPGGTAYPNVTLKTALKLKDVLKDIISLGYEKSSGNKNRSVYTKGNLLAPRHKKCTLIKGDSTLSDQLKIYCKNINEYVDFTGGETLMDIYSRLADRIPERPRK